MARPNMPTSAKERTIANTGARIMGSVPSMKGKAKEIALWRRDMSLGGVLGRFLTHIKSNRVGAA